MTRNSMTFQMGFDNFLERDPTDEEIELIIQSMDQRFDLVLVSDYLPQSLILLRHELCLSMEDIATLSKNKSIRKHIDETQRKKVREWQTVDSKIFEHANETLWQKIKEFGYQKMEKEVEALNKLNSENSENCVDSYMPVKSLPVEFRDYEPPGVQIEGIKLKSGFTDLCHSIALSPFAFAIDIQDRQCQDSSFLRNYAKLTQRTKHYGLDCPDPKLKS